MFQIIFRFIEKGKLLKGMSSAEEAEGAEQSGYAECSPTGFSKRSKHR